MPTKKKKNATEAYAYVKKMFTYVYKSTCVEIFVAAFFIIAIK